MLKYGRAIRNFLVKKSFLILYLRFPYRYYWHVKNYVSRQHLVSPAGPMYLLYCVLGKKWYILYDISIQRKVRADIFDRLYVWI